MLLSSDIPLRSALAIASVSGVGPWDTSAAAGGCADVEPLVEPLGAGAGAGATAADPLATESLSLLALGAELFPLRACPPSCPL